jgi:hypothetical protein
MGQTSASTQHAALPRVGITAIELAQRIPKRSGIDRLTADALARWLIDSGLADVDDGDLLRPTAKAVTVAGALDP